MKKKLILTILGVIVVLYAMLQLLPYPQADTRGLFSIKKGERPLVIAHGGAKLMNPENTVMAFDYAYNAGVDVLEMDLRLTKDNVLITHHNETIDETSDHTGLVKDHTYDELIQMNFGAKFTDYEGNQPYADLSSEELKSYLGALAPAKLEDLFGKYGNSVLYIIEIKDEGEAGRIAAKELNRLIVKYDLQDKVQVASFINDIMNYFNEIKDPRIETSLDFDTAKKFIISNYAGFGIFFTYEGVGMQLPTSQYNIPLATKYLIWKIHKNGMYVHYWTINDREEMIQCIKNGADGIITDRPDLLFEVLEELGY